MFSFFSMMSFEDVFYIFISDLELFSSGWLIPKCSPAIGSQEWPVKEGIAGFALVKIM